MSFYIESQITPVDASGLLALLPIFLDDCARHGRSQRTMENYAMHLQTFELWLSTHGPTFDYMLTPELLQGFAEWLANEHLSRKGKPYAKNSRSTFLKRVRHLFAWAYRTGRCDRDISAWVPQITQTAKEMRPIDVDGLCKMFLATTLGQPSKIERDMCVLALMAGTGARREEISEIHLDDIAFLADGYGTIYLRKTKNDKPRTVIFGPGTAWFLTRHLDRLGNNDDQLFNVESPALWKVIDKLARVADVGKISPHDLRKFFALHWMVNWGERDGWAELCLRRQLGHAARDVTEMHYLFVKPEHVRERFVSPMEEVYQEIVLGADAR